MKKTLKKISVIALSFSLIASSSTIINYVSPKSDNIIIANAASVKALWPVPEEYQYISSDFYANRGNGKTHRAIDIPADEGTDIYAVLDGEVIFAGILADAYNSCGNTVILYHKSIDKYTVYCHASKLCVSKGQTVEQGAVIAKVGNTGDSFGNHLDFKLCTGYSEGGIPWPRGHQDPMSYFEWHYVPDPIPDPFEELMFDADFYATKYSDLKKEFGNDEKKLRDHWYNYGIKEGRTASIFFDPQYYLAQNPDLKKAFGNDFEAARDHFVRFGYKENRKLSPVFDVKYYGENNRDLRSMNSEELIVHFFKYGINENRQASAEFDPVKYRSRYADLNKAYGGTSRLYYRHYMLCGKNEGRTAYFSSIYEESMFDAYFYYRNYKDLRDTFGYDPDKLCQHWLKYGIKEGRTASALFDPKYYLAQNSDLKKAFGNDFEAVHNHFVKYGYKENRKLSPVFDVKYYGKKYKDLNSMKSEQLIEHFYKYGMKEGRKASAEFDPVKYRNKYSDLNKAYGETMKLYYEHYMLAGINEKRTAE